jgi:predicted transposase YdaD
MCFLTNEDDNYWGISAKEDDNIRKEVGRKEGRKEEAIRDVALRMLEKGMEIEQIMNFTGLTKEAITMITQEPRLLLLPSCIA